MSHELCSSWMNLQFIRLIRRNTNNWTWSLSFNMFQERLSWFWWSMFRFLWRKYTNNSQIISNWWIDFISIPHAYRIFEIIFHFLFNGRHATKEDANLTDVINMAKSFNEHYKIMSWAVYHKVLGNLSMMSSIILYNLSVVILIASN